MFKQEDLDQISARGMTATQVQKQIDHFIHGFPFIRLARPALPGDGILTADESFRDECLSAYNRLAGTLQKLKFVPASGAASRMFKHLFEFRERYRPGPEGAELYEKDNGFNSVHYLMEHLSQAAFYDDLQQVLSGNGQSVDTLLAASEYGEIIRFILDSCGLDYSSLPKALLKFHSYDDGSRTAAEEHMVEAAEYASGSDGSARLHFTISPEHREKFLKLVGTVKEKYETRFGVRFDLSFSFQKPSTDTIAVDERNEPVRNPDGSLLFRPGGHGALLGNLNETDSGLVFIKNIDNIVPDRLKSHTILYKKVLGGCLLQLKEQIDRYLVILEQEQASPDELATIARFAREKLFIDLPAGFAGLAASGQVKLLFAFLNRPIRVCGMVRNEGEPGGGPFWVTGDDGTVSLQIVEASQINMGDPDQKQVVAASTHFNPVDLVCNFIDFRGRKFDLREFVDENTGFISLKSSGGKTLKAQELPGLWNGAMARWITVFIEVPIITFNPVKTVNDLLRKEHLK